MKLRKAKILGAYENKCVHCRGIVYKLKTSLGIIYQCKICGCTYR